MFFFGYFWFTQLGIKKIRKLYGRKIEVGCFFVVVFINFIGISLDDRKFSFADITIINFHNFLFIAVQNFKLCFLQKNSNFGQKIFDLRVLGLVILGLVFWSRIISLVYW